MKKRAVKILISLFALGVFFLIYAYAETFWLRVTSLQIKSSDIPSEFIGKKIVFATDFHSGLFFDGKRLDKVVEKINSLEPDIIILGGDYADYDKDYISPTFRRLAKLKARIGVYAVLGNRDYRTDVTAIKSAMAQSNIKLLDNSVKLVEVRGQEMMIAGVADFLQGKADVKPILKEVNPTHFTVLVSHNPTYIERVDTSKIDLVLSGHTHGGQVTFFGLWFPFFNFKYGNLYQKGIYHKGSTTILVSTGIGTRLLPFRFSARPEINVISLE